jgi:hypothetical protein
MALIDLVLQVCQDLGPHGWRNLLLKVSDLDID